MLVSTTSRGLLGSFMASGPDLFHFCSDLFHGQLFLDRGAHGTHDIGQYLLWSGFDHLDATLLLQFAEEGAGLSVTHFDAKRFHVVKLRHRSGHLERNANPKLLFVDLSYRLTALLRGK